MELKIFEFVEEAVGVLEESRTELEAASVELTDYFGELFRDSDEGVNISTRVKSALSLKEKILRNSYYSRYTLPELFEKLSDLIGVRIECRFIDDETRIYKKLKKYFNKPVRDGYSTQDMQKGILLNLSEKQPQEQKNGFKVYKIDGRYHRNGREINFELQIKSMVNMFWGEIEHKIIYKNYHYMAGNKFLSQMMGAINNNLAMIDNNLSMLYSQTVEMNTADSHTQKLGMEQFLSKMIYDIYSAKMKEGIGFIIDFRKSCDAVVKYIFRSRQAEDLQSYNETLLKTWARLNAIAENKIDFNKEIVLEREVRFDGTFADIVGNTLLQAVNQNFEWNLFFRILFEIEPGNNAEDFEAFVQFYESRFSGNRAFEKLHVHLGGERGETLKAALMGRIACCFKETGSIQFIYDCNIEALNSFLEDLADKMVSESAGQEEWGCVEDIYCGIFGLKVRSLLRLDVESAEVNEMMDRIQSVACGIEMRKSVARYLCKLEEQEKIAAEEAIKLFKL